MLLLFPEVAIQNTALENRLRGPLQLKNGAYVLEKIVQKWL